MNLSKPPHPPHSGQPHPEFSASLATDVIFTLITCGIYNLFIQNRQIRALNFILKRDKYSFGRWLILTLITCGLYHIYHNYIMSQDLIQASPPPHGANYSNEPIVVLALSCFGLSIVADLIIQNRLNNLFGEYRT